MDQLYLGDRINPVISVSSIKKTKDILMYFINNAKIVLNEIDTGEDIKAAIITSKAIKKIDRATAILKAIYSKELDINIAEAARRIGVSRRLMYKAADKIKQERLNKPKS
jgi:Fe-S cluster assembly ATPase SufC